MIITIAINAIISHGIVGGGVGGIVVVVVVVGGGIVVVVVVGIGTHSPFTHSSPLKQYSATSSLSLQELYHQTLPP